jgi:hypothetical protein
MERSDDRTPRPRRDHLDSGPPTRSKVTGGLAALACAACCAIPFLIAAGVMTGAGAALLRNGLLAVSATLVVAASGMWWSHRLRGRQKAAAGCGTAGCDCRDR